MLSLKNNKNAINDKIVVLLTLQDSNMFLSKTQQFFDKKLFLQHLSRTKYSLIVSEMKQMFISLAVRS